MKGIFQKGFGVVILIVVVAAVTIVGYSFVIGSSPIEVAKQIPNIIGGWLGVGTALPSQAVGLAQRTVEPLGKTTFGKTTRMKVPFGEKLVPGGITLGELPFYAITIAVCLGVTLAVLRRWVWEKYSLDMKWGSLKSNVLSFLGHDPAARLIRLGSMALLIYTFLRISAKEDLFIAGTVSLGNLALVGVLFFLWGKIASFFAPKARDVLVILVGIALLVALASALPKALRSPYGVMSTESWGRYAPVAAFAYGMTGGFSAEGMFAAMSAFIFWLAPKIPTIFERGPAEA